MDGQKESDQPNMDTNSKVDSSGRNGIDPTFGAELLRGLQAETSNIPTPTVSLNPTPVASVSQHPTPVASIQPTPVASLLPDGGLPLSRPSSKASQTSRVGLSTAALSDPHAHHVTLTVTIAQAVPSDESPDNIMGNENKKQPDTPRPQGYYHLEYNLMAGEDEPVKTDMVNYGQAAKVFMEKSDPRVIKTWQSGDLTWIGWSQNHTLTVTNDILLRLYRHTLEVKVWDTKEKCSTRAKFDRPKAFKLPQTKSGEMEDMTGVQSLVLKSSRSFLNMQPKKAAPVRPFPSTTTHKKLSGPSPVASQRFTSRAGNMSTLETPHSAKGRKTSSRQSSLSNRDGDKGLSGGKGRNEVLVAVANDGSNRHTSRLAQLAEVQASTPRSGATSSTNKSSSRGGKRKGKSAGKRRKSQAEQQNGVCQVQVRLATLFLGSKIATGRLNLPVTGLEDVYVSVTVDKPLMSEAQAQQLNPMFITIKSANSLPATPLSFDQLHEICKPVFCKYKFFDQPEHSSISKSQRDAIYWDDVNIALVGDLDRARLVEYLRGPGLQIEVHDRDRQPRDKILIPSIFGDDLEDEKISNVGTVASRRTTHNAFKGVEETWDPYGIANVDLSDLLLGSRYLCLSVPILRCKMPDILGDGVDSKGKIVGIPGSVDGPVDDPLPAGDYVDSESLLKIEIQLAHPLITSQDVLMKEYVPMSTTCPFNRMVFKFVYGKAHLLPIIQGLIAKINARALGMENLSPHVRDAALATYKLSKAQKADRDLDIITGFHIVDGEMQMLVIEGLRDSAIAEMWDAMVHPFDKDLRIMYNSDMQFTERLYNDLNIDIPVIKLHEPLSHIIQHPLLYIRDMVPKSCFMAIQCLTEIVQMHHMEDLIVQMHHMEDLVRNQLFPTSDAISSLSKEFGVPVTAEDFLDMKPVDKDKVATPHVSIQSDHQCHTMTKRHEWTPIQHFNPKYVDSIISRLEADYDRDFIEENKHGVQLISIRNRIENEKNRANEIYADVEVAHNYSSQNLNSSNIAMQELRNKLSKENPDRRFTYSQSYSDSMTILPSESKETLKLRESYLFALNKTYGWKYPGVRSAMLDNRHPYAPDMFRVKELEEKWKENSLHRNILEPSIERDLYPWNLRRYDMNLISQPHGCFHVEPISIMEAGVHLAAERNAVKEHEENLWNDKLVVDDAAFHLHRLLPDTELTVQGPKSSNQIDRLTQLLKDTPAKLSFTRPGMKLKPLPPLSVVNYPDLEKDSPIKEAPLMNETCKGLNSGPYLDIGCIMDKNTRPTFDYMHSHFDKLRGKDFSYHGHNKYRNIIRPIKPITKKERDTHLFSEKDSPIYDLSDSPNSPDTGSSQIESFKQTEVIKV